MSIVYLARGEDREAFIRAVFQRFEVEKRVTGKQILVKPNMVSHETYPTTTHPATLTACIRLLLPFAAKIVVADGPAWDAGDSKAIIERHPMKQEQILKTFSSKKYSNDDIIMRLNILESKKSIIKIVYNEEIFWRLNTNENS